MITILEADKEVFYSAIPREEEGMGICAGAYLGNKLPCIMMQNTGIGNSVNSIVSLLQLYQMPIVFLISYRGTPGEPVGAQGAMASVTEEILNTLRIPILHCNKESDIHKIETQSKHCLLYTSPSPRD